MKNFLMIACVAVCTVFMAGNTSYAIGGGNGGGGGKVASQHGFVWLAQMYRQHLALYAAN